MQQGKVAWSWEQGHAAGSSSIELGTVIWSWEQKLLTKSPLIKNN